MSILTASNVITYGPIVISLIALHYSRKAYLYQVKAKRREQVALISLNRSAVFERIELVNPALAPIAQLEFWYHHINIGTFRIYQRFALKPNAKYSWGPLDNSLDDSATPVDSSRKLRAAKRKYGSVYIAEAILQDASGEQWYINTSGRRIRIPRILANSRAARWAVRAIGYPAWSRFGLTHLIGLTVWTLNLALAVDHYGNNGRILRQLSHVIVAALG